MRPVSQEQVLSGRYRLTTQLGDTGVWRARDELLRREVAVTRMRQTSEEDLAAEFAAASEAVRGRAVTLTAVHDLVVEEDASWLVMRFDLRRRRRRTVVVAAVCVAALAVTATTLAVVTSRPPSFATTPRACELLTTADAATLVPQPRPKVITPSPPDPVSNNCEITTADKVLEAGQTPTLVVFVKWHGDDEDKAAADFADERQEAESQRKVLLPAGPAEQPMSPVSGLGDEAYSTGGVLKLDDKRRMRFSQVVYRLGAVVVSVGYGDVMREPQPSGPLKESVLELAHRSVEGLER